MLRNQKISFIVVVFLVSIAASCDLETGEYFCLRESSGLFLYTTKQSKGGYTGLSLHNNSNPVRCLEDNDNSYSYSYLFHYTNTTNTSNLINKYTNGPVSRVIYSYKDEESKENILGFVLYDDPTDYDKSVRIVVSSINESLFSIVSADGEWMANGGYHYSGVSHVNATTNINLAIQWELICSGTKPTIPTPRPPRTTTTTKTPTTLTTSQETIPPPSSIPTTLTTSQETIPTPSSIPTTLTTSQETIPTPSSIPTTPTTSRETIPTPSSIQPSSLSTSQPPEFDSTQPFSNNASLQVDCFIHFGFTVIILYTFLLSVRCL